MWKCRHTFEISELNLKRINFDQKSMPTKKKKTALFLSKWQILYDNGDIIRKSTPNDHYGWILSWKKIFAWIHRISGGINAFQCITHGFSNFIYMPTFFVFVFWIRRQIAYLQFMIRFCWVFSNLGWHNHCTFIVCDYRIRILISCMLSSDVSSTNLTLN